MSDPTRDWHTCSTCEPWQGEYNVAVANGLGGQARLIDRRIAAHERDVAPHAAALSTTPAPPAAIEDETAFYGDPCPTCHSSWRAEAWFQFNLRKKAERAISTTPAPLDHGWHPGHDSEPPLSTTLAPDLVAAAERFVKCETPLASGEAEAHRADIETALAVLSPS